MLHMNKIRLASLPQAWSEGGIMLFRELSPWYYCCLDGLDFLVLVNHGAECYSHGLQWDILLGKQLTT